MNDRLIELAGRQGALRARIADQRMVLARQIQPVESALALADHGVAGLEWIKNNPLAVGGAVAVLAVLRPKRAWQWTKRGVVVWRGWRALKNLLQKTG